MKVLVTGYQGYIGSVLVRLLKEHGHSVTGLDTGYFEDGVFGPAPVAPDRVLNMDIRRVSPADLDGVDAVVHLAALSDDPVGELDPALTDVINRQGTIHVATCAREAGVGRFLFSSSTSVYGAAASNAVMTETSPVSPITAYAKSKAAAERELMALTTDTFCPVCFRSATAYGASPRIRFCTLVVHNLMAAAMGTGKVLVKSDGTPWRPLVHVEDIAGAFVAGLGAPADAVCGEVFNVGQDSENFQVRQIAETVQQVVPGAGLEITGESGPDRRSYRVGFGKIATGLPGFRPGWDLQAGCEDLYRFLVDNSFSEAIYGDRRYLRLKKIRHLMDSGLVDEALYWSDRRD